MDAIEDECRRRPKRIGLRILQEWLAGKGLPVDWQTLIDTLRYSDISTLANTVQGEDSIPLTADALDTEYILYMLEHRHHDGTLMMNVLYLCL